MSEVKFTKGPLSAERNTSGSWEVVFGSGSCVRGEEYMAIGTTSSKTDSECCTDGETSKANAMLFSKAPEMYEMLEYVMKCAAMQDNLTIDANEISKLLAKARGEHV